MNTERDQTPVLKAVDMTVNYQLRGRYPFSPKKVVHAVDGLSFDVHAGQSFGIVGESGCGKSSAALAIAGLIPLTSGSVFVDGKQVAPCKTRITKDLRARYQIIFQDPYASLDPRQRVRDIIAKPLRQLTDLSNGEIQRRVREIMTAVGLRADQEMLFPHQFSGGQRQRVGIARAIITNPKLIICDEPVSALDVAVQAQILNLLKKLQQELGLTYLFISHDLGVVHHLCDYVAVMYLGKMVETGPAASVFREPLHPYTTALLAANPSKDPRKRSTNKEAGLKGEIPSAIDRPSGCAFHTRCPLAVDICRTIEPERRQLSCGRTVACHLVEQ